MTNKAPAKPPTRAEVYWGTVNFQASDAAITIAEQSSPRVSSGNQSGLDRSTQPGQQKVWFGEYSGGQSRFTTITTLEDGITQYTDNEGLVTRLAELGLYPPYLPHTQSSLTGEIDLSAIGTKRLHAMVSAKGSTYERWLAGIGNIILAATNDSTPALVVAKTLTNNVTAVCGYAVLGGVSYALYATDGTTDDIKGITDVDGSLTVTEVVTNGSGDAIRAIKHFPELRTTIFVGKNGGGTEGVWSADTDKSTPIAALDPVVYKDSKDIDGSIATASLGPFAPIAAASSNPGQSAGLSAFSWQDPGNVLVDDSSYATVFGGIGSPSDPSNNLDVDFSGQFNAIPLGAIITGIVVRAKHKESNADDNAIWASVHLLLDGSSVGTEMADATEFVTSEAFKTFGSTTNSWGQRFNGEQARRIGVRIVVSGTGGTSVTASINYVDMALTYRMPGAQATLGSSYGFLPCDMPNFKNRMVYINQPFGDSPVTLPSEMVYLDFERDIAGDRPVVTFTWPNTGGLRYIWHATDIAGGVAITGSESLTVGSPLGDSVFFVNEEGKPSDFQLPKIGFYCNALGKVGTYLVAQMVKWDGATVSDLQYWFYDVARQNPAWFRDTVLSSKLSLGIDALPVPYAEFTLNPTSSQIYSVYGQPNNSDHMGVRYEFIPSDLNAPPQSYNSTFVKPQLFDAPLSLTGREMFLSYPEASDTIVELQYQDRQVTASSNTIGKVTMEIDTGGDYSFAAAEITKQFEEPLQVYSVPANGAEAKTIIPRFTLDLGSVSSIGPVGPKVLMTTVPEWPVLRRVVFTVTGWVKDIYAKLDEITALQEDKSVQSLEFGQYVGANAWNAAFDPASTVTSKLPPRGSPPDTVGTVQFVFRQVPG